jgi:hypothetical protein
MRLATLAQKARELPDLDFEWGGPEQWHDEVFDRCITTLPEAINYINDLRKRMAVQSHAISSLKDAYEKMKDIILEAEVES